MSGGTPGFDVYHFQASTSGVLARPAATAPETCTPPFLAIASESTAVPPKGAMVFIATGGSTIGYAWSLATNSSGASINASTGAYTAGPTGSVTDTVKVTDSIGNTATRNVSVTAGVSISPANASAPARGTVSFTASGGSGTGFAWSIATNSSGGSINASTGAYTAGPTANVTDLISVTDSLGNTATAKVAVTPPPGGGGCSSTTAFQGAPTLLLWLAALLRYRRKSSSQADSKRHG